jgi:hypothetical protein
MPRCKAKQSSLRSAGLLPTLKKPAEAIGFTCHTPGDFWDGCPAADKKKLYSCNVRTFEAVHKFPGSRPPSSAFEVQEMGEHGTGSLEPGVASGEVFWTLETEELSPILDKAREVMVYETTGRASSPSAPPMVASCSATYQSRCRLSCGCQPRG